jgi:predicted transcriptional regulator
MRKRRIIVAQDAQKVEEGTIMELVADIVSAYVSNNTMVAADLPGLITEVHGALRKAALKEVMPVKEKLKPAVPISKSVTDEHIICLEDGKQFKSLKRHLRTHYDISPEEYREKWGLAADYPMVAPKYAEQRSRLAKDMGLGRRRQRKR